MNEVKEILLSNEDIWKDTNRFKELICEQIQDDKKKRNLLLICIDEEIPDAIIKDGVDATNINTYKKLLIEASGCTEENADKIIKIWLEALEILQTKKEIEKSPLDFIMMQQNKYDQFLEKTFSNVDDFVKTDTGFVFKTEKYKEILDGPFYCPVEELEIDLSTYFRLRKYGLDTVRDIYGMELDTFQDMLSNEAEELKAALLKKGLELVPGKQGYLSKYPNYVADTIHEKAVAWRQELLLEALLVNVNAMHRYHESKARDQYAEHAILEDLNKFRGNSAYEKMVGLIRSITKEIEKWIPEVEIEEESFEKYDEEKILHLSEALVFPYKWMIRLDRGVSENADIDQAVKEPIMELTSEIETAYSDYVDRLIGYRKELRQYRNGERKKVRMDFTVPLIKWAGNMIEIINPSGKDI